MAEPGHAEIYERIREVERMANEAKSSSTLAVEKLAIHEKTCSERYQSINENLKGLNNRWWQVVATLIALLTAILLKAYNLT